jgi:sulfhydrogenase subunit beta (sulfur reductase)
MEKLYIKTDDWQGFIKEKIKEKIIYAPFEENNLLFYQIVDEKNIEKIVYNRIRTVEPFKIFLFPFKERILPEINHLNNVIVMGVTSCDLKGLEILDKVFMEGEFKDPNYKRRKEKLFIISFDCEEPYDSCFCSLVGVNPYPEKNFDLNLKN